MSEKENYENKNRTGSGTERKLTSYGDELRQSVRKSQSTIYGRKVAPSQPKLSWVQTPDGKWVRLSEKTAEEKSGQAADSASIPASQPAKATEKGIERFRHTTKASEVKAEEGAEADVSVTFGAEEKKQKVSKKSGKAGRDHSFLASVHSLRKEHIIAGKKEENKPDNTKKEEAAEFKENPSVPKKYDFLSDEDSSVNAEHRLEGRVLREDPNLFQADKRKPGLALQHKKKKKSMGFKGSRTGLLVLILAVLVVLLIFVGVTVSRSGAGDTSAEETVSSETADTGQAEVETTETPQATADGSGPVEPEKDDGTGAAGTIAVPDAFLTDAATLGWHEDDAGPWYSVGNNLFYYNGWETIDGNSYHFNTDGRADRGWKLIGGQSCYFDDNGVYQPDADNSKLLCFTFDDGPSEGTDQLLALCEETGARVTFFMIGVQVENGGAVIPHIIADRCELGNHTYSHTQQTKLSTEESVADINKCDEFIASFSGGAVSTVLRYPYGDYTPEQLAAANKPSIFWDIDTLDWESEDAESIKNIIRTEISEGDIILMHDRVSASVEACQELFPELIAEGYQLVTISEMAAAKGIELQPGYTYYSFCNDDIEAGTAYGA